MILRNLVDSYILAVKRQVDFDPSMRIDAKEKGGVLLRQYVCSA